MNRFYRKATRERALIRTGAGGKRVVMDGGCWVLPFLHQVESVDMRTVHVEVRRNGERAVLTADRLRVDITASFHVRVVPTEDGIATAAQALGARSLNQERIADFLSSHFVNAIQGVAAARTMDTLHEERTAFISDIRTALQGELETSGLALESVSLTQFDQTPLAAIDENNAFNAVGMRRLAELITENRRRRKEIEAEAEVAIHRTELETFKSQVNIGIEREQAEIEKRIETERLGALADRRIAEERERAEAEAGRARLRREQDVRQARFPSPRRPPRATTISSPATVSSPRASLLSAAMITVPAGTGIRRSAPARPVRSLPCPCRPRSARKRLLKRKSTRVLRLGSAHSTTSPPSPPSPPSGPPLGMYFSRLKLRQPFPPAPASTVIAASSTNFMGGVPRNLLPRTGGFAMHPPARGSARLHAHVLAPVRAPALERHHPVGGGEESVVPAAADVHSRVEPGSALAHDDASSLGRLTREQLDTQSFGVRVAPVLATAACLLVCHRRTLTSLAGRRIPVSPP